MNLLTQNKKIKQSSTNGLRIFNFGIPAYKSLSGKLTCPNALHCIKGCYARQGAYIWSNVAKVFESRYELTKSDLFIDAMTNEINKKRPNIIRIHDSGDFYSPQYLHKWIIIINKHPNIIFYAYTKMVGLFKKLGDLKPINFIVIYSLGGKEDHLIDLNKDRHSKVFNNEYDLISQGYIDSSKDDKHAFQSINNKIGLVYHGAKSKDWSDNI